MKKLLYIACVLCAAGILAACAQGAQQSAAAADTRQLDECPYNLSCLTGQALPANATHGVRPVAVALDNVRAALPQRGISGAKIVYEALYGGGITHLLAVYDDYVLMPETGPVTVLDSQLASLSLPLDAMCLSTSATPEAGALIDEHGKADFYLNGTFETSALSLDSDRNSVTDISRCWFTNGTLLSMAVKQYSITPTTSSRRCAFNFADNGTVRTLGASAKSVGIRFSGYTSTVLEYSSVYKKYYKSQFDARQLDENTSLTLCFDNVIVLFGDILSNGSESASFDFTSGGDGYYFYGGKYEPITWSKAGADEPLLFRNADGTALINRGTTYVALADKQKLEHFEITA